MPHKRTWASRPCYIRCQMSKPWIFRAEAGVELIQRSLTLRAASIDEKGRTVECTLATENKTRVFDPGVGRIDEILLAGGGDFPKQMPLLAVHDRYSLDSVLGSVRDIRREGNAWVGRLFFAGSPAAEAAWQMVGEGHLTDVSVGYRAVEGVVIEPGRSANVSGTNYSSSSDAPLRITTRWQPRECSLVPVGADPATKVRAAPDNVDIMRRPPQERCGPMNPLLKRYLVSLGLRADASDSEAQAFNAALGGVNRASADSIVTGNLGEREVEALIKRASPAPAPPSAPAATPPTSAVNPPVDTDLLRRQAIEAERTRQSEIRTQAAGIGLPEETVARAINDGWDIARFNTEALTHVRNGRAPAVPPDHGRAPAAGRGRPAASEVNLGLMLAMRAALGTDEKRIAAFAKRKGLGNWEQLAAEADCYRALSLLDVCRQSLALDHREVPLAEDEIVRAAVSGGAAANIFTDSVNATVNAAYEEESDTTDWADVGDVKDFKTQTAINYAANSSLRKLGRGGTAQDADVEDGAETYKIARFARKLTIDDQDIIDDNFDILVATPREMGRASARLRPDLVYAILLDNPAMADTGDVFNATAITTAGGHMNYASSGSDVVGGALSAAALQAAFTYMRKQYRVAGKEKVPLNIVPEYLVVPPDLQFTAEILLQSAERIIAASSYGTYNPMKGRLQLRVEQRIGALGFRDPDSGSTMTGTVTNYFLFSRPGLHLKVAYRRGTNRSPVIRGYVLDKGQYGLGWDVAMDIGAKFTDFRGAFMAKGAS